MHQASARRCPAEALSRTGVAPRALWTRTSRSATSATTMAIEIFSQIGLAIFVALWRRLSALRVRTQTVDGGGIAAIFFVVRAGRAGGELWPHRRFWLHKEQTRYM